MREILFRGQRITDKKWVEGFLLQGINKGVMLIQFWDDEIGYCMEDIIPETVGQLLYTDKKNNNYFNGDIFEHNYYPDCLCRIYFSEDLLAVVGQIYDKNGEYELVTILPSDFENYMKLVGSVHENTKN